MSMEALEKSRAPGGAHHLLGRLVAEWQGTATTWAWRTTVQLADSDHLVVTHFNITPDGDEALAVEIRYESKA